MAASSILAGRSPCRERGLKFRVPVPAASTPRSLPVQGAWIEIATANTAYGSTAVAPRAGSVD